MGAASWLTRPARPNLQCLRSVRAEDGRQQIAQACHEDEPAAPLQRCTAHVLEVQGTGKGR